VPLRRRASDLDLYATRYGRQRTFGGVFDGEKPAKALLEQKGRFVSHDAFHQAW
jgi:hypothetical protein